MTSTLRKDICHQDSMACALLRQVVSFDEHPFIDDLISRVSLWKEEESFSVFDFASIVRCLQLER